MPTSAQRLLLEEKLSPKVTDVVSCIWMLLCGYTTSDLAALGHLLLKEKAYPSVMALP